MITKKASRRDFLRASAAAAAAGILAPGCRSVPQRRIFGAGEKLNLGVVGVANRGYDNLKEVASENIVALCDVDEGFLDRAAAEFPRAKKFVDYREMLAEREDLDGVVVSTPDHTHASATAAALDRGLHVYCEKPLAHSVAEARFIADLAEDRRAVTQMGTQIHANANYRRAVELVRAGAIGPVSEVHVFCSKTWSGGDRPAERPEIPKGLHWDLWLGPAPERPYHPAYLPANWRRWWEFGGGTLADMGCHYMDLAFWALDLEHPVSVEAEGPEVHPETTPAWLIVHYEFPSVAGRPPVRLRWYDGGKKPPALAALGLEKWDNGVLFLGDRHWLIADYDNRALDPGNGFTGPIPAEHVIPDSVGHHREWILACKSGGIVPTSCPFEYSGALTEAVLLGNVAFRMGRRLEWDADRMRVANAPREAAAFIDPRRRYGWDLAGKRRFLGLFS